jgi:serine/threonine protein kinase
MSALDKYEIIKKLGSGSFGDTFLVKYKDKQYAMKIENVIEEEIKKDLSSPIWREIEFARTMHKECPNHIMKLYEYDIIENCKHKHNIKDQISNDSFRPNPKKFQEYYDKKMNSTYCFRTIYSLVDVTIRQYKKELIKQPQEVWYSLFIQYFYVTYCLHKKEYSHSDLHLDNIGIVFTKDKTMTVFKKYVIPTFGMKLVLMDYGLVLNKKYAMNENHFFRNETSRYDFCMKHECSNFINHYFDLNLDYIKIKNEINKYIPNYNYDEINILEFTMIGHNLYEMINPNQHLLIKKYILHFYLLLNPDEFQKMIFKNKKHKPIPVKTILDVEDYRYMIKFIPIQHYNDIRAIGEYFINKLKNIYIKPT